MATLAAGRYSQLESVRWTVLERARDAAKLTIPALMPPDGHSYVSKLPTPYQGIGARGVNNLASKLLLALLPPNSPFFRMIVDDFTLEKMTQRPGMRAEVEKALNKYERAIMTKIEVLAIRVSIFEALKHLINDGNVLLHVTKEGVRVFRLDQYVVVRDPSGNVIEIIVKESVTPLSLPEQIRKAAMGPGATDADAMKNVDVYTHIKRNPTQWTIYQEVNGLKIPGSIGQYPLKKSPWIPLRWTKIDGEDYGRGYIEEYLGDLRSLEGLTQAIVEGSAAAAKVLFLVNPNGTTQMKQIAEAPTGAIRPGRAEDVSVLQLEKFSDFQIAFKTIEMIQQRLSFAFMLNAAVQRNGERVTAEEIRFMAGELEDALGGVYSILSQELQYPLVVTLIHMMERAGDLPSLPKELVRPTITTGLEALGRGHDLNRLQLMLQQIAPLGPEVIQQHLNISDYIARVGTSLGIDMDGLIRSPEELQQAQQMAMMQQMMDKLGPKGMDIVRDQMKPEATNGPQAVQAEAPQ